LHITQLAVLSATSVRVVAEQRQELGIRVSGMAQPSQVQSVDRALSVLELLAAHGELGVTEIAAELGVHKSTAFRLVTALEGRRLVEQVSDRGKYRLGLGILRLAAATTGRLELSREGRDICEHLAKECNETVNLAILDDGAAVNVLQELGDASVASRDWIGRRTPLHATSSGKVLLAHTSDRIRDAALAAPLEAFTPRTVTDASRLSDELGRARTAGWASTDEELELGLTALAAPVRDGSGRVVAAISVSGPSYRLPPQDRPALVEQLRAAATELSLRMGFSAG
jgi:DNA-binding IclR family transcriptional regulator